MYRCDLHIIRFHNNKDWFNQCINSLKDEPINLHLIHGVAGHIGHKRYEGYQRGAAEYVSFVDDDDYIEPGAIQHCVDLLDQHPEAVGVSTRERYFWEDGKTSESLIYVPLSNNPFMTQLQYDLVYIHHVVVMRRKMIEPYLEVIKDCNSYVDKTLYITLYHNGYRFIFDNNVMYNYRQHPNQSKRTIKPNEYSREIFKTLNKGGKINPNVVLKKIR